MAPISTHIHIFRCFMNLLLIFVTILNNTQINYLYKHIIIMEKKQTFKTGNMSMLDLHHVTHILYAT
jgi:hypothetical protein